jgi:carbon-monoxide dehydrogenase medium subunit
MISSDFDFQKPTRLEEALELLARHGDNAKILAGGMSLVPMMTLGLVQPKVVISLNHLSGLDYVRDGGDAVYIGAMTRHRQVEMDPLIARECSLLAAAAKCIGDVQVRNRGTIGGSLAHADPAADYPPVLLAGGARIVIRGSEGQRIVPADEFFLGMMQTAVGPRDLLVEIQIAKTRGMAWSYQRLHRVEGSFAIVNVAAIYDSRVHTTRIAIGGACPSFVVLDLSDALTSGKPDPIIIERKVLDATEGAMTDISGDAEYRQHMAAVLTARALDEAISRSGGNISA